MAQLIEKSAKTVQEAISAALQELNADESQVNIEVLEEGSKGIFGLIGNKLARIRVTLKETNVDKALKFLQDILEKMSIDADVEVKEEDDSVLFKINGDKIGILIGRRGETLDSIQYLTSLVVNKGKGNYKRVVIDIENYREKREETLVKLANKLSEKVVRYKKDITLESMNPYERRVIHSTLQNNSSVRTYSIGEEPNRKVVITLNRR
jgi:spoIIIJ-associated protein